MPTAQSVAVAITGGLAIVATYVILKAPDALTGLRVSRALGFCGNETTEESSDEEGRSDHPAFQA